MDGTDLGVRLRREGCEKVVGCLAFLHLPYGRPVCLDTSKAGEGTALVEREPDVATLALVELAERGERTGGGRWKRGCLADDKPMKSKPVHTLGLATIIFCCPMCGLT
jgi:hypothetical protein